VVVVVDGRHGGGGGVQLDLLEHLRRERIRVILRIIKNRKRYASTVVRHLCTSPSTETLLPLQTAVRAPSLLGWGRGKYRGAISPVAFAKKSRDKNPTPLKLHYYNSIMMYFLTPVFVFKLPNVKKCQLIN